MTTEVYFIVLAIGGLLGKITRDYTDNPIWVIPVSVLWWLFVTFLKVYFPI